VGIQSPKGKVVGEEACFNIQLSKIHVGERYVEEEMGYEILEIMREMPGTKILCSSGDAAG